MDSELTHVRDAISHLSYPGLVAEGIIPDIAQHWTIIASEYPKSSYPVFVLKNKEYSQYGYFIDLLMRKMLFDTFPGRIDLKQSRDQNLYTQAKNWKDSVLPYATQFLSSPEAINRSFGSLTNIFKWLIDTIPKLDITPSPIILAPEYNFDTLTSHPDLLVGSKVCDFKHTISWDKMEEKTILQLLSYFAILRALGYEVNHIVVLLPVTKQTLLYDLSIWSPDSFLERLLSASPSTPSTPSAPIIVTLPASISSLQDVLDRIGHHTHKEHRTMERSIQLYLKKEGPRPKACQMFISQSRSGRHCLEYYDLLRAHDVIVCADLHYYTHVPYTINLCWPVTKYSVLEADPKAWALTLLTDNLHATSLLGGRGTVIHVGSSLKMDPIVALAWMKYHVQCVLPYATERNPLLIETPCHEGTELLWRVEDLANFYLSFSDDERKVVGICIDTCHVFASGYQPDDYLIKLLALVGSDPIRLIHFNGARFPLNSRRDGHGSPFQSHIESQRMINVAILAAAHGIDLVVE